MFYASTALSPTRERIGNPGRRQSQPVRSGNSASGQTQLGTYGDFFDTISRFCAEGHVIDATQDGCSLIWPSAAVTNGEP